MRLLVVADIHYALPQYDWVLEVAGDFDLVIIAGDLLDTSSLVDLTAQILVVEKYIQRIAAKTRVIVCSGNHDLDMRSEAGEKIVRWILTPRTWGVPTDGDSYLVGDTLFTVCPWWDGPVVRDAIAAQLAADAPRRPANWYWVHHAPPKDSPIAWDGRRSYGDGELLQWIAQYKPDIVFSGHVHQAPFSQGGSWADRVGDTWVFNAGHQFGAPPAHIIVDTDRQVALWFSAAGNQRLPLDRPLERPIEKLTEIPDWLRVADQPPGGLIPA